MATVYILIKVSIYLSIYLSVYLSTVSIYGKTKSKDMTVPVEI